MSGPRIDELDRAIIRALLPDARITNRRIAEALGVTEGTVRARIRRLERERLLRFTAFASAAHAGREKLAFIGLHVDRERIQAVAERVSSIPAMHCCITLLGRFDVMAIGLFRDLGHMLEVLSREVAVLPGVRHVETSVSIRTVKANPHLARITDGASGPGRGGAPPRRTPKRGARVRRAPVAGPRTG